jgi:hypothetical protein
MVDDPASVARTRWLLIRIDAGIRLALNGPATPDVLTTVVADDIRHVVAVPTAPSGWDRIVIQPMRHGAPLTINEIGLLETWDGLVRPAGQPFAAVGAARFYAVFATLATLGASALLVVAVILVPDAVPRRVAPSLLAVFCAAVCILELGTTFSPYWSHDLRSVSAAELARSGTSGNLTGGLYEGSRIVQGLGQTVSPGVVQWHRMPGYGLFCAAAATLGRTTDLIEISVIAVLLQVAAYCAAVALFVAAARPVFGPRMAWVLGVLLALMPKQVANTQTDALIAPIGLTVLAALLMAIAEEREHGAVTVRTFALVNGAFALWFLMRNDVLPGWIVVSALLAGRRLRLLAVPLILMITIALPWALYKRQYRGELDLLPSNTGEVMFLSLCEVPGAFRYPCTDAGYFDWATRISQADPTSGRASSRAVVEVLRHWVTYPIHFGLMVWFKFRRCVYDWAWPGFQTPVNRLYITVRELGGFGLLLALAATSWLVGHERRRTLLLGWALVLNMPLFLVMFDSAGRFYGAVGVAAVATAVPLIFERGLYTQMARHPRRVAAAIACVAVFVAAGERVERWVISHDSVHYWTPLLDARQSTLRFETK